MKWSTLQSNRSILESSLCVPHKYSTSALEEWKDKEERYEDSYAVTEEFREWITCMGENDAMLEDSVLTVPRNQSKRGSMRNSLSSDFQLEIWRIY